MSSARFSTLLRSLAFRNAKTAKAISAAAQKQRQEQSVLSGRGWDGMQVHG